MLRRKLLTIYGSLVALLMAMVITVILSLHGVLARLDHSNNEALAFVNLTSGLNRTIAMVRIDLYRLRMGQDRHLDGLIEEVERGRGLLTRMERHYRVQDGEIGRLCDLLRRKYPQFERQIGSLATVQDAALADRRNMEALEEAVALSEMLTKVEDFARERARQEQDDVTSRLRWLVFALGLGCMLVINVTILILLRSASMVLRPVDKLVEASRKYIHDHFDYRANLDQKDEFLEMADAYNRLAERVQSAERQRLEMVAQVAVTLNHELNNAMATIEMQLQLLASQSGSGEKYQAPLRQIRENLRRMAATVASLKHIRRIVLTEYISGTQMLDLQRSVEDKPAELHQAGAAEGPP